MNSNRNLRWVIGHLLAVFLLLQTAGIAHATITAPYTPGSVSDLTTYLKKLDVTAYTGSLAGAYDVTSLDYEAGDKIRFNVGGANGLTLFTNKQTTTEAGTWKSVTAIENTNFYDVNRGDLLSTNNRQLVHVFSLNQDWTTKNHVVLTAGTLILGLNDLGSTDKDYDDFIIAAKAKPANTPIPAAIWLLGSGIAGLAGFRRFSSRQGEKLG